MQTPRRWKLKGRAVGAAARCVALLLMTAGLGGPASGHEIESSRLTLVLRDERHVSLSLFLDYPATLHRVLAPTAPYSEFIVVHSSLSAAEFRKALARAERALQSGIRISDGGRDLEISGWKWPDADRAQALIREVAMAGLVDPAGHAHASPLEVRAEALAPAPVRGVDLSLPPALADVIVVSYRPRQQIVAPGARPTRITF